MTYAKKLSQQYLEFARTPVSDTSFSGEDARYSAEYEALENELNKTSRPHEIGSIDWQLICSGSSTFLAEQSKDLRVATWLAWSLYQVESFSGLLAGLSVLRYLCEDHWSELHPRKSRTRAASLNWLVSRTEQVFADLIPVAEQLPTFRMIAENLRALDKVLSEHLGEDSPMLLPMCRRLEEMVKRASEDKPEPGAVSSAIAQVKQVASQIIGTPSAPGSVDNEKDAHKALRTLQEGSRPLCNWWLKQNVADLKALRLSRSLLWLNIDSLPERNTDNITPLRGIPKDKLSNFRERLAQQHYADVLVDIEASIARAPFWLDGQRLAWECLQALKAIDALYELETHMALLIKRLPGITELRFHDGTPFADDETRSWINQHVAPHLGKSETRTVTASFEPGKAPVWETALQDAIKLLPTEGLRDSLQPLKQGLHAAHGGRERFFWHLALARLSYQAKKYELAKTQLQTLDRMLQDAGLADWEPDLTLEVLRLLHSCCELLPQSHAVREDKDEIHRRLCHLDVEMVLD